MDELLKLLGLVDSSKKAEAQVLVDAIKAKINELDAQIITQEKLKLDAIKSRDEMKATLKSIAIKLGATDVENINDAIEAIKNKKGVSKIEELEVKDKEIEKLKSEIETLTKKMETIKEESQNEIRNIVLERDLALVLPKYKAVEELVPYLIQDIKKMAKVDDKGKLVFKNEDGTTLRINGRDATLDDIISQKREAEIKKGKGIFFDITVQNSGAGGAGGAGVEEDDFLLR